MKFENNEQFHKLFIAFGMSVISVLSRPNLPAMIRNTLPGSTYGLILPIPLVIHWPKWVIGPAILDLREKKKKIIKNVSCALGSIYRLHILSA